MALLLVLILFILFYKSFFWLIKNATHMNKKMIRLLALICALPVFRLNSIVFLFEVHILILSFLCILFLKFVMKHRILTRQALQKVLLISLFISSGTMLYGYWNMKHIVRSYYQIETEKPMMEDLTLVMLSDLHYSTSTNKAELQELVNRIEKEEAEVILLNGDIVDENTTEEQKEEVFDVLGDLTQESQVFYTFGNHELNRYFLKEEDTLSNLVKTIEDNGIQVLADQSADINENVCLVGRMDYKKKDRKQLSELLNDCDAEDLIIVADHQPRELQEAAKQKADLHLSGHTHAGQLFPMYYIFELFHINELNYGCRSIESMSAINSSGVSGWGFPIRTQKQSEYVVIDVVKSKS